ncbi:MULTISPECIES: hypothetical protein [unclassified Ensifer]|uniref:hypothetical protein n=1 Tax=unclassified Ensifer TaxID=2633371 RepID=UPI0008136DD3|nr:MULTISPECIES: hypothetical protein [unclassified Ensifer]OCO98967.1 hypothetical protein BC362_27425 [Ensifer sp. LC14]OCP11413.1 hypothetical protein BC374_17245 [Ensifer sp. LC13]OCP33454.1 hypothetical protein BC364_15970 [Ensifer sp. LC499]
MSAAQLAVAAPGSSLCNNSLSQAVVQSPHRRSNDMVLNALTQMIAVLDGVVRQRREKQIARNRVEARRELAKLPKRVRDDVMFADPLINHHV